MHEIGLLRQLVRTVTAFAEENGVSEISGVVVDCGELSLVIPEYLEELYPIAAKNSILQDAKLTINMIPGLAECDDCDEIFNVIEHKIYSPVRTNGQEDGRWIYATNWNCRTAPSAAALDCWRRRTAGAGM